jgi:hypothetical protein
MRSEFNADFREDIQSFLPRDLVESCATQKVAMPDPRKRYTAFVDPSGGRSDSMTLAIAHSEGDLVFVDRIEERIPPFDPAEVVKEFSSIIKSFGLHSATSDRYGGVWVSDAFQKQGLRMDMSDQSASDLYLNFAALCSMNRAKLPDSDRLISQLTALERRTGRNGRDTVEHPASGHDDLANAVAGAVVLASNSPSGDIMMPVVRKTLEFQEALTSEEEMRKFLGGNRMIR